MAINSGVGILYIRDVTNKDHLKRREIDKGEHCFLRGSQCPTATTFLITEHCFGHQIVNFSPIALIFGEQAPLYQ